MNMSEETKRMQRDMSENPELAEKMKAEIQRLTEAGEIRNESEILMKAAASLGYSVSLEEVERAYAEMADVDDRELAAVTGGGTLGPNDSGPCIVFWSCFMMLIPG